MLVHSWTGELNKFVESPNAGGNLIDNKGIPQLARPRVAILINALDATTHHRFISYTAYQKLRMVQRVKY